MYRFPYLLQDDEQLCKTLSSHGWEVDLKQMRVLWAYSEEDIDSGRWLIKPSSTASKTQEWYNILYFTIKY